MARVNPHRKDLKKKGRDSDDEVPNVHVAWMPKDQEIDIACDEYTMSDRSTVGSTKNGRRYQRYPGSEYPQLNDPYSLDRMRENGWCNKDGTPWFDACPCDEAALLKKGLISRDCKRQTYGAKRSDKSKSSKSSKYSENSLMHSLTPRKSLSRTQIIKVGDKSDPGTLTLTARDGVRTFELQTKKRSIVLEHGKKHAYLVSSFK